MRGCGMMGRFMATTLSDLFLRVVLAMLFSRWLGVNGIWLSWPVAGLWAPCSPWCFIVPLFTGRQKKKRRCNFFDMGESLHFTMKQSEQNEKITKNSMDFLVAFT